MSWKQLLAARKVHTHQTSKQELDELRAVIRRDLSDAAIPALSEDRRLVFLYRSELQLTPKGSTSMHLEVDLCCVVDGKLCIGEAKSNGSLKSDKLDAQQ